MFFTGYKLDSENEEKLSEYQYKSDHSESDGFENISTEPDWIVPDNYQSEDDYNEGTTASETDSSENSRIKQQNYDNSITDQLDPKASPKS